jgi:Flp pilus assembly protein TadG
MSHTALFTTEGRRLRCHRVGATAVDLALVLPAMFWVVFGSIELGRVMMARAALADAARGGARVGALSGQSNSDVTDAVNGLLAQAGLGSGGATTTILVNGSAADVSTAASGDRVTVTVSMPVNSVSRLAAPVFTGNMRLAQTSVMRCE